MDSIVEINECIWNYIIIIYIEIILFIIVYNDTLWIPLNYILSPRNLVCLISVNTFINVLYLTYQLVCRGTKSNNNDEQTKAFCKLHLQKSNFFHQWKIFYTHSQIRIVILIKLPKHIWNTAFHVRCLFYSTHMHRELPSSIYKRIVS